jgi:hypothetical protein
VRRRWPGAPASRRGAEETRKIRKIGKRGGGPVAAVLGENGQDGKQENANIRFLLWTEKKKENGQSPPGRNRKEGKGIAS